MAILDYPEVQNWLETNKDKLETQSLKELLYRLYIQSGWFGGDGLVGFRASGVLAMVLGVSMSGSFRIVFNLSPNDPKYFSVHLYLDGWKPVLTFGGNNTTPELIGMLPSTPSEASDADLRKIVAFLMKEDRYPANLISQVLELAKIERG
jgi:hypothetical protein